ncbi:MAG: DUF2309 domain-containing protein [Pseudomonadota bacterium]
MNAYSLYQDAEQSGSEIRRPDREEIQATAAKSSDRIAPLWPLKHAVAVNPYLGLLDMTFEQADDWLAGACGSKLSLSRQHYLDALQSGRLCSSTTRSVFTAAGHADPTGTIDELAQEIESTGTPLQAFAEYLSGARKRPIQTFIKERISQWAMSYFDEGQAIWSADQTGSIFTSWLTYAKVDRTPDTTGFKGCRAQFKTLPDNAEDTIDFIVSEMSLPGERLGTYFDRLLMGINGWASYARYLSWQKGLQGETDSSVLEMLAIRLAWDWAIWSSAEENERESWAKSWTASTQDYPQSDEIGRLLHNAYEASWQKELITSINSAGTAGQAIRPDAQAVFCIDVRSEVYRRALESQMPGIQTIGFAGFFGAAIEYIPLGAERGSAQCPVLLSPAYNIKETTGTSEDDRLIKQKHFSEAALSAWRSLRTGAVSSFAFVETMGLGFASRLISESLGWTRPVKDPAHRGVKSSDAERMGPSIHACKSSGIPVEDRLNLALGMLKGMSLTENFARLVLITGHAAESVNNPHASGLDCGACGGHGGQANAQVSAKLLNNADVRKALTEHGVTIPEDTVFVAGQHNTTTDDVTLFDIDTVPASHLEDLSKLQSALERAGDVAREERKAKLGLRNENKVTKSVRGRANDWSQVRPEWGLAGCAAFIAAPRERTRSVNLDGRCFLHSYNASADSDGSILELIMTAPMVVASWISLQYFASSIDNETFGCGEKPLHNVVGKIGVLEGNGGDLRTGLPWQSVHNGEKLVHEPMRLNVMIEATPEAMNTVIAKHEMVRQLVDHKWLHLFSIGADGQVAQKYSGEGKWAPCR